MISENRCIFIVLNYKDLQTIIAMITESKVIALFCMADEFCKFFDAMMTKYTLKPATKRKYHRDSTMSKAEIMLILILFHDSGYRCLKHFYLEKVCKHMRHLFPKVVSYNRFVELEKEVAIPLALFIKKVLLGKCTGISFVDSTPLRVCKNQRIHIHKTFKGIAQRGKCSMGWFFGFKLHLICNERGELLNFMIIPGDVDDRKSLEYKSFVEFIYGKLVGDKGYIGKNLFERLFVDGIQLITKLQQYVGDRIIDVFGHRAVDDLDRVSLGDRRAGQYVERPEIRRFERIVVGRGVERELHPETFACRDDHRGVGAESNLVGSCCGADEDYET